MAKSGSKLLTGILCFLFGFIFAILVEVGAVFGVYMYAMNTDINKVMAMIGLPNTDDRYINTDKDNGGVSNLKELLSGVKGLVFENGELAIAGKSFNDISNLVPATQILLDKVYEISGDYIEIDRDEFQSNPLMNLAQVLSDSVMNIKTGPLLEKLGVMDSLAGDGSSIVKSLVAGTECEYASITYADGRESTLKLPVMYDYYMMQAGGYARVDYDGLARPVNGVSAYHSNLSESWLSPSGKIKDGDSEFDRYMLCYVPCKVTASGIEEAEYIVDEYVKTEGDKTYKFQIIKYGEGTDFIAVKANGGNYEIDYDAVYASLNAGSTSVSDRFTGYSYYEPYATNYYYDAYYKDQDGKKIDKPIIKTISGKNYFVDSQGKTVQLDALTLFDIMADPFTPLDSVLVTEVVKSDNEADNKSIEKIFGTTTLGMLLRGEGVNDIINDLEVCDFVDKITPDNKLMCYIAYKISDLQPQPDGSYTAVYDMGGEEKQVTVLCDIAGYVVEVNDTDGNAVAGVKVSEVAQIASGMPVTVLMDVRVDEPIIAYLGYGVTNVTAATGDGYSYTGKVKIGTDKKDCFIATVQDGGVEKITSVWYFDDGGNKVTVGGSGVNDIADRVNSFADDLTLGDIMKLDGTEPKLLTALADTTINGMEARISELTVGEIFEDSEIESSAMLRQLKNKKVTELATAIDELCIQSIYFKEIYGVDENAKPEATTEFHAEWLYYVEENGSLVLDHTLADAETDQTAKDDALGHITSDMLSNGKTYYSYGETTGMWRIVLLKDGVEKAYTINNFNNMVAVCAQNVNKATLNELKDAGVVEATAEDLAKKVKFTYMGAEVYLKADGTATVNESEGVTLGEMTVEKLVDFVLTYFVA